MKRSLLAAAAAAALALAPAMLHAQTYPITSYSPLFAPVVGAQFVLAISTSDSPLPDPSATQACFYVSDEAATTSTALNIQTGTGVYLGFVTSTVPASYLATVAPADINPSGFVVASVYFVPTGSTCTGTADPAYSGTADVFIEAPQFVASSTNNLPLTNTALTSASPVLFTVTGKYFSPSTILQITGLPSGTVTATTKYLSSNALLVTSPTIPSSASSAQLQMITIGSQGSYPATTQGSLGFYAIRQSTLGTPTVTANPAGAGATLTFSAVSQDAGADSMQQGGVPTGAITMTETNTSDQTVGSTVTGALTTNPLSTSFTTVSGFTDNNTGDDLYTTIADFNGDGVPDVLVVESVDSKDVLAMSPGGYPLLGDFDQTFSSNLPSTCEAFGLTPGDINGDGILDLAVLCGDTVTGMIDYVIMLGNGDGTFTYSNTVDKGQANGLALGDFFHHGKLDLAAIGTDPSETFTQINLYPGNGDGTFGATTITSLSNPNLGFPASPILSTDIDGDGYPDMVVNVSSDVIVLVSNGDGTVGNAAAGTPNFDYAAGGGAMVNYAVAADVNNDNKTDILFTGNVNGEAVPVRHPLSSREKMRAAAARRGILVPPAGEKSPVAIQPPAVPPQRSQRSAAGSPATVKPDAVKPKAIGPNIVALLNTSTPGSVSFATPVTTSLPTVANAPIAVANFDGDCCNDVLISDGANLIVYSGNNTGTFTASDTNLTTALPGGSEGLFAVAGVDVNGDGAADLIYSAEIPGSGSPQYSVGAALTTGTASASTVGNPGLPPGTYTVNYTYNGNSLVYTGSTTTLNPLTITTEATATTVMASAPSVVFGQSETLTATIAQGTTTSYLPTGTVTFLNGPTLLGSGTVSGGQVVLSGVDLAVGSYTIKATYSGDTYNAGSSGTVSFTVTQATPTITWAAPASIAYGTALSATQLDATASVPGTFVYTPAAGTVLAVGSHTLSVTFTPTDTTDYTNASGTANLFVNAPGNTLYSFCAQAGCADGTDPEDALIQAADGYYYGTVDTGGASGLGAFFRVSSTGQEATLYSFGAQSGDGTMVAAALVQGTDGNFYGATQRGGANGAGTVLQVTPAGAQTTLYSFTSDAAGSVSGLVEDLTGNFYGTKAFGGAGNGGTVFKLSPSGSAFTFSTIYPFCSQPSCADGNAPFSGLVQGTDGNFYGTTEAGGANNEGTVYKITPGGAFTLVHSFSGSDGQAPYGGLVQGADGNFYGTTRTGGGTSGDGTVYRMTPGGTLTTLYSFSGTDGANPYLAVLALGSDGNFYGTTSHGGGANDGTVFQITTAGALTTLHSFCSQASCTDGNFPIGGVIQGSDGNFYGATADGGASSDGAVYEVSPGALAAPVQLSLSSPSITLGAPVTLSWNSLNAFSGTMQQCAAILLNGATPAAAGNWTGLQSGTLAAGVYSGSASISPTVAGSYTYGLTCGGVESAAPVSLTVNQATPTLTWAAPSAISYGTALSATQLDATASTAGTFAYTPASGTVLTAGSHTLSVTFTPTDTTDYTTATKTVSITVNQATPTITWAAPAAISYGTALSATQLDATASTAGTFVYTPAAGTVLAAGTQTLSVTFTPTDTTDYTAATKTVSLTVNQATPTLTWAAPSAISYGTALSATQLDATASTAGTFAYTPASGTVLAAGTQTLSVTFTPTDTTDYTTATKTVSLTVNQATPTITWAAPAAISYGTALSATQLDATASTAGTFVYIPAAGTVLAAGTQTLSVTFTPTDTTDYTTATKTVSITVNQATPTITWAAPAAISYGTALSATQLDATASTAGTFVYTPAAGTVPAAGTQTLSVTFTPTDTTDYTTATKTVSLTVNQATPTITWAAPAAISYGTALSATQLDATASTAGTFVYTPASGTVLTAGSHTLSVTFTPTDTTDYTTATKTVSLTVNQVTPTLTWAAPSAISYGTALSATQLDATASTAGTFVYTPAAGTVPAAGTQTLSVTFTPTDTTDYTTATKTVSLTVNQATPTITWAAPSAISYGTALSATQLDATASTAGTFVYTPASGTVLAAGTQTLSVTFTPTDTTDYTTATKTVSLTVNQATPTITWAAPAAISYGTALSATQLDATASTAGTFVYIPAAGTVLAAGTQTLSVTFTPTDTTDYTTATKTVSLTVNQATPTITWAAPSAISYGTALSATQLDATSGGVAGTFVYTPAAGTVPAAGTQTLSVTFTPTDTTDYTTATKTVSLTVNQATPTITWAAPAAISYGTALSATQLDATASGVSGTLAGTFAYTPASGTVLTAGTHTLSVTFTPTDTTDYTTATKTVSLTVSQATPTLTWAAPAAITYGAALSATQLDATATGVSGTLAGTFVYTPASGTVLTAGTPTLSVTFTPTDATDYTTATKTVSITVNQATPTLTWAAPAPIAYGTALSATQLDATASVAGTFLYTPAAGTVLPTGAQTLSVTFTPTDTTDYTTATKTVSLSVGQTTPTLTWTAPASIAYGAALSATQLDATASVAGTFAYTPAAGTVLTAGTQTLSVTFTPNDTTDYSTATKTVSIMVTQAAPTLTWTAPAAIAYGTALSATQLDATATGISGTLAGTFAYTPIAGTVLTAGAHTLSVTFTPTDTTDYTTATKTVSITVNKTTPTITWSNPAAIAYGTALSATQLDATASGASGTLAGAFVYTPASGTVLTAGTQTLSVTFTPTDTTDYTTASKTVSLTVSQATPTLTWAAPAAIAYGTALSATQLDATATGVSGTLAGTFVYTPASGTVLTAGTQTLSVTFTPTDTTDYISATKTVSITITQATPTVNWNPPPAIPYGTPLSATQLDANATGISGGALAGTFTYNPPAGTVLTAGTHTLDVTFTPTDSTDYTVATGSITLGVSKATPTVTWTAPAAVAYGTLLSATQLNATATGINGTLAGAFAYNPPAGTLLTAGTHALQVIFTPTDTTDYTNSNGGVSITVNQATPTLTWTAPSAITYGTALSATQLNATAAGVSGTLAGTLAYTPAAGTVLATGAQTLSVSFTPTDITDYIAATKTVSITVNQATLTITANSFGIEQGQAIPALTYAVTGFQNGDTQATATTGAPSLSTTAMPSSGAGTYPITPVQNTLAATNYTFSFVNGALTVTAFSIGSLSSDSIAAGSSAATITLTGSGFTVNDVVTVNGTAISTTYNSPTSLTATIPASYLTTSNTTLQIAVKDNSNGVSTASTPFVVGPKVLGVATSILPNVTVGAAYTATLTATGGVTPYTWSIISGALPAGLTLDANTGVISGTPTAIGTPSFTVQATDSESTPMTTTAVLAIGVNATQSLVYNFCATTTTCPDGDGPTELIQADDGNFYGVTEAGGVNTLGTFYQLTPAGVETVLYNFCSQGADACTDGSTPVSLVLGGDGNFYGVTTEGGADQEGSIFQITPAGTLTTLYSFCVGSSTCPDGMNPEIQLTPSGNGIFFGTTPEGGANGFGTVFEINTTGTFKTLYSFTGGTDGGTPNGLIQASDGNFYGVAQSGGYTNSACTFATCGTIFRITPKGNLTTIYSFCSPAAGSCPDGYFPVGVLNEGADGNLYGATQFGGSNGAGTVFNVTTAGTLTTLYNFCTGGGTTLCNTEGGNPQNGIALGSDGNFYGASGLGGNSANSDGAAYQMTSAGNLTVAYNFCTLTNCDDGSYPATPPVQGNDGNFYGTTSQGGSTNGPDNVGGGVIYKLTGGGLQAPVQMTLSSTSAAYGTPVTLSWQARNAFSTTAQQCYAYVLAGGTAAGNWTGLQSGTLTAGVYSGSATLTPTTVGTYTYGLTCGGVESAAPVSLTVTADTTSTALTSSVPTAAYGMPISLTATITPQITGGAASTASVTFYDAETPIGAVASSGFSATLTGVELAAGAHTLYAVYAGDSNYQTSDGSENLTITSGVLTVTANNLSMQQGATVPTLTYGITGFQYSDNQSNATTGAPALSTTATSSSPVGMYPITVAQGTLAAANYTFTLANGTLTVNPNTLAITTSTLPVGKTGAAYTATLAASGGVAPYSWSVTTGVLPAGLTLAASTGVIAGTPTAAGATNFTLTVTDSESTPMTAFVQFSISINSTENILDAFCQTTGCPDGENPRDGVIQASDGNFYGTTAFDGAHNGGTVFKITPSGTLTTLYNFCSQANCADGSQPKGLRQAADGNFYSVALSGGLNNGGTVFKITPAGVFTLLYQFCLQANCTDGQTPTDVLLPGSDGNFYGTTEYGGENENGTVFKITPTGTLTTLYSFCAQSGCNDGALPLTGLVQGADGDFYGVTSTDGVNENGTAFKITPTGTLTTLYSFCAQTNCSDGSSPNSNLVQGSDGNFYGVTQSGGNGTNNGTVFNLTPAGALTTLYEFCTLANCADGAQPSVGMVLGSDGNFYGTTQDSGAGNAGTFFQLVSGPGPAGPQYSVNTLYSFCSLTNCADGSTPEGFVQANDGNFYGTAEYGGSANNAGLVYELPASPALPSPVQLSLSAATVTYGGSVTLNWQVLNAFSTTAQQCYAFINTGAANGGTWTGMQPGTLTSGIYSGSATLTPTAVGTYSYALTCGGVESGLTGTLTVTPAVLTVSANNLTLEQGQAIPTLTYAITGFQNGDMQATATTGAPTLSTTATQSSAPNAYPITVAQGTLAATNYTFAFVPGTLTLTPFSVTSLNPNSAPTGSPNTAVTVTGQGFTASDTVLANGSPLTTTYSSATSLSATIPAADLTTMTTLQIAVMDTSTSVTTAAVPFTVGPAVVAVTTTSLPSVTVNTAYSATLAATGGVAPYTWSIASGALPAGLSLAPTTGVISGTPTAAGIAAFTVKTTDSETTPMTATASLTLGVNADESVVYNFCSLTSCADGDQPTSGVVQANDGNFYGTADFGGANNDGTLFRVTPSGAYTTLYSFCSQPNCNDGTTPVAGLVQGGNGNFYGMTEMGGANGDGVFFNITSTGAYGALYYFCGLSSCADGELPEYSLVQGSDGNFYGVTTQGGSKNDGTVFKVTSAGALTTLYSFCTLASCADGSAPEAALVQGSDGNFYGTTSAGGANNRGTVFQITPAGTLTTVYSFCTLANCADGNTPRAGLVEGADGNFYGTTYQGGNSSNPNGTVYKVTPAGTLTTLYSFGNLANSADGINPLAGLVLGSDGNFYGATPNGGNSSNYGTVFQITPSGNFTTIYSFCSVPNCTDADFPQASLVQGSDGNFYSTAETGGSGVVSGAGAIYKVSPSPTLAAPVQLTLSSPSASLGTPVTLSWQVLNAFSTTLQQCYAFVLNGATTAGTWTGLQTGTLTAGVYSGSASITPTATGTYQYALTCGGTESAAPVTLTVTALNAPTITAITPITTPAGSAATPITITGTNFDTTDVVLVNGHATTNTVFNSANGTLSATIPASYLTLPNDLIISIMDTASGLSNSTAPTFSVTSTTTTALTPSSTSPVYGTPISLTATATPAVTGGITPNYSITFFDGATLLGTMTGTGFSATLTGLQLSAGVHSLSATFTDTDAPINYISSTGTDSLTVTPAVLTVTANNLSKTQGAANPTLTYTITGFQYADTQATATTGAPALTTTATTNSPAGAYPITITQGTLAAANYAFSLVNGTLTVNGTGLAVTTTSLPSVMVNAAYPATTLAATGGLAPYTWSVTQGALPLGLSLAPTTGVISGTPTTVGVAAFTVTVTDSESTPATATARLAIAVNNVQSVLYTFCQTSGCPDGADPYTTNLIQGTDGNYYGTTYAGGTNAKGTVFKITPAGTLTNLYSFCNQTNCADGNGPVGLMQGSDGNLYGATYQGGANGNHGTVFKLTPSGAFTTLYSFCSQASCADGVSPNVGLVQGTDGNFYGTAGTGGVGVRGTVFKITPSGALTTLYSFCSQTNCADGADPYAVLVQGTDGNFYGTTEDGGANSTGTVFKITPSGTLTTLYSFCSQTNCTDGDVPIGGLTQGNDGNFYGATSAGGNSNSECASGSGTCGTLFKITPGGALTTLYSFCSQANCADGSGSIAGLVQGSDGNFYGTTAAGGITTTECAGCGTLFKITPGGALTTLYSFCSQANCADGDSPFTGLAQGSDGNLYGTTYLGGANNDGTVFNLPLSPALAAPVQLSLSAPSTTVGSPVTLTWQVLNAFSTTLQQCYAFVLNGATTAGNWTGLQTGTLTAGVYSGSATITPTANGSYQYGFTCGGTESAAPVMLAVGIEVTTTALTPSVTSPVYGTPISLTATTTPSNPSGPPSTANVSFYDGATLLGTVASSGFSAALTGLQLAAGTHSLSAVFAGDSNYQTSTGTLSLTVTPAVLTVTANNLSKQQGAANPTLTYTITGFQYADTQATATTGAPTLSTTATTTSPVGTYPITITQNKLEAANYTFSFVNGTLTVTGNALTLNTTSLPIGKVGVAYSTTLTASGGITPYTWSLTFGTLPAGLSLNSSSGVISGTPTAPGVQTFTVQVADSESPPAIQAVPLSLAVNSTENIIAPLCAQAGCPDGSDPRSAVIEASDGNLYGAAYQGGPAKDGAIFKISPKGALSLLYTFCTQTNCPDGEFPQGLVEGPDGALYGTTFGSGSGAGVSNFGTVFKITTAGSLTTLYSFCSQANCADGQGPGNLTFGSDGNLYGATGLGGANGSGSLFKITPGGVFTQLYSFCATAGCPDGSQPSAGLMQASDGNFYGVTSFGGSQNSGLLYKLTPAGAVTGLYSFCQLNDCADGSAPDSVLVQGANGNLYGATSTGGSADDGALFDIALNGTLTLLDSFTGANGNSPNDLVLGSDGNFYGTSQSLGEGNGGTFFELTPAGAQTTLYTFCSQANCADGGTPEGLLQASDGQFYGTASTGAANSGGAIVQLPITPALPAPVQLALSSSSTTVGTPVRLTFNVLNAFSTTLEQCYAFVQNAATGAGNWTGIQTGTLTSGVYTGAVTITPTAPGTYTYALTCGGVESGFSGALTVTPAKGQLTLTSFTPNASNIGAANTTITLTGTGFNALDQAQVNGTSITTNFVSATTLTAVIPAANFAVPAVLEISVFDPTAVASTQSLPLTVSAPPVDLTFSGPSTSTSASQPDLTFNLTNPYPVELTATLTLTFEGAEGVDDPNIEFANGSRTFSFNIAANTTTTPTIQLQTGTDAGNISIALGIALTSNGQDVTPNVNPVVINIPAEAPVITSMTLTRSGDSITVNIIGYSNTRDMTEAAFTFTSAAAISNPDITIPETALFGGWYSSAPSDAFGSEFLYTQAFTLNDDSSNISQVTVTLTNSAGTSSSATAQ